jgi:hypothetical protein
MTTAYRAEERGRIRCEPAPFSYQFEGTYTRQLLVNAVVVVVLAAVTVMLALSLATVGA